MGLERRMGKRIQMGMEWTMARKRSLEPPTTVDEAGMALR